MSSDLVLSAQPLSFPWPGTDPYLFCAYHDDRYPAGNERLGPAASLSGRNIGQDFEGKDGWRMYHGSVVPGFPRHPHRGFETVTIMRSGYIDHSDSLGATARFGPGDVQWITAGKGIVHAEMFPLLERDKPNPVSLFQIWLNLPSGDKMADPHFAMLWDEAVPRHVMRDEHGRETEVTVAAGRIGDARALVPPPRSWAARPEAEVAIWTIKMAPEARFTLPAASAGLNRTLYYFKGESLSLGKGASPSLGDGSVPVMTMLRLRSDSEATLVNGPVESEILMLQGRPIGEPVAQYGPFVMNTRTEIEQAFRDYQRTEFGGWPWPADDYVHAPTAGRHARYIDGRVEQAG